MPGTIDRLAGGLVDGEEVMAIDKKAHDRRGPQLSDSFFTGAWAELQYQDSLIADYVLGHMQARGQGALPVHDSFIVQDQHLAQLFATMKEAYRMLGIDSIPDVESKKGANTTFDKPYFMELWRGMDKESKKNKKELESINKLDELLSIVSCSLLGTESGLPNNPKKWLISRHKRLGNG